MIKQQTQKTQNNTQTDSTLFVNKTVCKVVLAVDGLISSVFSVQILQESLRKSTLKVLKLTRKQWEYNGSAPDTQGPCGSSQQTTVTASQEYMTSKWIDHWLH